MPMLARDAQLSWPSTWNGSAQRVDDLLRDERRRRAPRRARTARSRIRRRPGAPTVSSRAHALREALRDLLQQLVADAVSQRVVDGLEAVEVDEHDPGGPLSALCMAERLPQPVVEQLPIRQTCQAVVMRQMQQVLLQLLALGDAFDQIDKIVRLAPCIAHQRRRYCDPDRRAVLVQIALLKSHIDGPPASTSFLRSTLFAMSSGCVIS